MYVCLFCCRDFGEVNGFCFKDLIVGKSSTLNFYQAQNTANVTEHMVRRLAAPCATLAPELGTLSAASE